MRIFDPDVLVRGFKELGLAGDDLAKWDSMVAQPNGIILVTGPTGSGKTTTLYSTLKKLATDEVNVCTIEDPIEMIEGSFNQMQVQHNIELDFAEGVRALMRQDPDIIMVGEIRDLETAEMAIQAALTGHLVLSTLHTNDAPSSVTRLEDLGVQPFLIAATILGIMAQRLVRTLCPHCKVESECDEQAWVELTRPWKAPVPKKIFAPKGCLECRDTGYLGRMGVYEIMLMSHELRRIISAGAPLGDIRKQAYKEGLLPLRKDITTLAVIGPNADYVDALVGNYNGTPTHPATIFAGIRKKLGDSGNVAYAKGCDHTSGTPAGTAEALTVA